MGPASPTATQSSPVPQDTVSLSVPVDVASFGPRVAMDTAESCQVAPASRV